MVSKKQVACCVLVMAVFTTGVLAQLNDTHYAIEFHGVTIHCKLCPAGTYWIKHCSQDGGQTGCQECPDGKYKTDNNRALYCERCTECKGNDQPSGEILKEACSRFNDTKCECKPGCYREEGQVGDCREVSPCMPGYGVKKMANSHKDTTCERCVNGKTFSSISSEVTPCQNCSHCPEGWVQKIPCNETQDTVCMLKDEVKADILIIILLGVACVVLLTVAVVSYYFRRTNPFLQKLCLCWKNEQHLEKADEREKKILRSNSLDLLENHIQREVNGTPWKTT